MKRSKNALPLLCLLGATTHVGSHQYWREATKLKTINKRTGINRIDQRTTSFDRITTHVQLLHTLVLLTSSILINSSFHKINNLYTLDRVRVPVVFLPSKHQLFFHFTTSTSDTNIAHTFECRYTRPIAARRCTFAAVLNFNSSFISQHQLTKNTHGIASTFESKLRPAVPTQ